MHLQVKGEVKEQKGPSLPRSRKGRNGLGAQWSPCQGPTKWEELS